MALENEMTAVLVLSGEATREDADRSPFRPHHIVPSLGSLV
jgi:ribonucleotide monophosphatase NagD (HAD superfamily)